MTRFAMGDGPSPGTFAPLRRHPIPVGEGQGKS
jgi:hypothetical protein